MNEKEDLRFRHQISSRLAIMEIDRAKRIKDKTNIILKRSEQIRGWAISLQAADFLEDEKTKLATYKAFQEIVEACMDIVAMMCKDMDIVPKDDYTNIDNLLEIDQRTKASLYEANGLRNRLVHRYDQTDDRIAFEGIKILLPELVDFVGKVKTWIRNRLR